MRSYFKLNEQNIFTLELIILKNLSRMFRQQYKELFSHHKQPPLLLVRIPKKKKGSIQKLLLRSFAQSPIERQPKISHVKTPPIHNSTFLYPNIEQSLQNIREIDEVPLSYRKLQVRISKHNSFNRRIYDEQSPTKKSLFFRNLKKCSSSLSSQAFQNAIQHGVTKKKIATKEQAMKQSQMFWETVKEKLSTKDKHKQTLKQTQKIKQIEIKRKLEYNKIIHDESPSKTVKKYRKKDQSHLRKQKKKQMTSHEEYIEVRPWNHTKKIQTLTSGNRCSSADSRAQIEQHY